MSLTKKPGFRPGFLLSLQMSETLMVHLSLLIIVLMLRKLMGLSL